MRTFHPKLAIIAATSAALFLLTSALTARRPLIEYLVFRCGLDWLSPISHLEYLLLFRFGLVALGLVAAILSALPLGRPYSLRAFNAALGIACAMLAIFGGGWHTSRTAYLNGLAAAVSEPETGAALQELQHKITEFESGTETKIKPEEIPRALRELGNPFFGATILRSGEVRLLWGNRATGGWGVSIATTPPAGVNVHTKHAFENVYVHMNEPF